MTRFHRYPVFRLASAVSFLLLSTGGVSFAQELESRAKEQRDQQEEKADSPLTLLPSLIKERLPNGVKDGGAPHGFAPAFGDIKRGSGFAPGVAYGYELPTGGVIVLKGAYSIHNYKVAQIAAQSAPLAAGRLIFRGRARWQDAPSVRLYGLGSDSPDFRTAYAETKTEVSSEAAWTPARVIRFVAGIGLERFDTGLAHNEEEPDRFVLFAGMPGAGADPRYVHSQASAAIDLRDSPGYSRRGSLLSAGFHHFRETNSGPLSFQRVDVVAEQYIPIIRNHSAVFVNLHVATTVTDSSHAVPFFLLPDLGGHDLRGFPDWRFRDRHAINWTAEYRWFALESLDAAVFYDAGKAVSTRSALDFSGLKSSIGGGVRLHSSRSTFVRLEAAHSREGMRFIIAFSPVGQ
jgi:Omp85 superfamily domain